ncbi:MAG TPA: sigma-70 family RNA polymerase sigma factor [Phycisphaerae bacterium]|jgi:RNA polymerase sigma-70 factor (ECF subfamily)
MSAAEQESELIAQAVAGDGPALEQLLLHYHERLTARIARKLPSSLGSTVDPEDILQETFVEAFRGITGFRPAGRDAFYRWLTWIADNRLTDHVRAQRADKRGGGRRAAEAAFDPAHSGVVQLLEMVAVHERTPSRSAAGHEAVSAVQSALSGLDPVYREVLRMRYLEGQPVAAVAASMHRTEAAIHKLCTRGLRKLRGVLGESSQFLTRA